MLKRQVRYQFKNKIKAPLEVVVGTKRALRADEFAEFMMLFNKAYTLGVSQRDLLDKHINVVRKPRHRALLLEQLRRSRGFRDPLTGPTSPLIMTRIQKSSPLMLVFVGVQLAIVGAVILSGGEVAFPGFRFKVRSLGYGLKKLRDAFADSKGRSSKKSSRRRTSS